MKILITVFIFAFYHSCVIADSFKVVEKGVILIPGFESLVDMDRDNIPTMKDFEIHYEDDGSVKEESEGKIDKCPNIPNVSLDDDHCSVDLSNDGFFTLIDMVISRAYKDHYIEGSIYPDLNYPANFGGHVCYYPMRVIEYNKRLIDAGLPLMQTQQPSGNVEFLVKQPGWHCFLPAGHHSYPVIP